MRDIRYLPWSGPEMWDKLVCDWILHFGEDYASDLGQARDSSLIHWHQPEHHFLLEQQLLGVQKLNRA